MGQVYSCETTHGPLVIDGSFEQRLEVATIVAELTDEIRRLELAIDIAKGHLRWMMLSDPKRAVLSIRTLTHEIRLKRHRDIRCAIHRRPICVCYPAHNGDPVSVVEVEFDRYFSVRRLDTPDSESDSCL